MKNISDYDFYDSWQPVELDLKPGLDYDVLMDLCELKKGTKVQFSGFCDIDNHYGVFVFTDMNGELLEVRGDFCTSKHNSFINLRAALKNA